MPYKLDESWKNPAEGYKRVWNADYVQGAGDFQSKALEVIDSMILKENQSDEYYYALLNVFDVIENLKAD